MSESLESLDAETLAKLAAIGHRVLSNPKTRDRGLELYAEADPEARIPELENKKFVMREIQERDKKIREMEARLARRDKRDEMMAKGLVSSMSEFDEVEKFGVDNQIYDYEKAANFYKMQQQAATPATPTVFPDFAPPELPKLDLNRNPWRQGRAEADKAIQDILSGKVNLNQM